MHCFYRDEIPSRCPNDRCQAKYVTRHCPAEKQFAAPVCNPVGRSASRDQPPQTGGRVTFLLLELTRENLFLFRSRKGSLDFRCRKSLEKCRLKT